MTFVWQLSLVMLGSAIGGGLRFAVYEAYFRWTKISEFPIGTLTVNVAGCFLISLIAHVALSSNLISTNTRLFLTTGIMGGLTTYSAFNFDLVEALKDGAYRAAILNTAVTLVLCLLAGLLGLAAGKAMVASR